MATTTTITSEEEQLSVHELSHIRTERHGGSDSGPSGLDSMNESEPGAVKLPLLKIFSASFSFFVAGVNDGSVGPLIPYVIRDYHVNTAIVSSVYVKPHFKLN